jgi:hypothetical protein
MDARPPNRRRIIQRRYRDRVRRGAWTIPVEVNDEIMGALVDTGWIKEAESDNTRENRPTQAEVIKRLLRRAIDSLTRG